MSKIKIESHGISPWHYFLENMSWGFSRKQEDDDIMSFLNVDPNLENGGCGLEDVLMADFLQSLSFADSSLLDAILTTAKCPVQLKKAEIRGNAGNYYLPYEDEKNGIRLAQPDGWIADETTLILLEAKGYRKTASLNKGQLAKEFLIAQNVAKNTGRKNFYVMLIANDLKNIYKSGKDKFDLSAKNFSMLWEKNVADLEDFLQDKKEKLREDKFPADSDNPIMTWEKFAKLSADDVQSHFLWITWGQIATMIAEKFKDNLCAQEIKKTIDFHSRQGDERPVFSQFLAELAKAQTPVPLYQFYNGGCGNQILKKYEQTFLDSIRMKDNPWTKWHELAQEKNAEKFSELSNLEERRRKAVAELKAVSKDIRAFYKREWSEIKSPKTTRKAFEIFGESANLDNKSNLFEQRMPLPKKASSKDQEN